MHSFNVPGNNYIDLMKPQRKTEPFVGLRVAEGAERA
jgi:hypothetical protein